MEKIVVVVNCKTGDVFKKIHGVFPSYVAAVKSAFSEAEKDNIVEQNIHRYTVDARRADVSCLEPYILIRDSALNNLFIIQKKEME